MQKIHCIFGVFLGLVIIFYYRPLARSVSEGQFNMYGIKFSEKFKKFCLRINELTLLGIGIGCIIFCIIMYVYRL